MKEKSQYKSLAEWKKVNPKDYGIAMKNDWLDDICKMFGWERIHKPSGFWQIKKNVLVEAKKYKFRSEWIKKSGGSYTSARMNGWLDECAEHMELLNKPNGYWTKELCIEEAKKYKTRIDWKNYDSKSYQSACKYNWLDECCQHMELVNKPNGYWTKELCIEEAKKHKGRTEWYKNNSTSYSRANQNGWLDECCQHMEFGQFRWTKELCIQEAKNYNSITEWQKNNSSSYRASLNNDWKGECTKHMK